MVLNHNQKLIGDKLIIIMFQELDLSIKWIRQGADFINVCKQVKEMLEW